MAAEEGDEGVFAVDGDLVVAEVADPEAVVVGDAGDDDHAESFHLGSEAGFCGDAAPVRLTVGDGSDDEPQLVTARRAQPLGVDLGFVVAADTWSGAHRCIPRSRAGVAALVGDLGEEEEPGDLVVEVELVPFVEDGVGEPGEVMVGLVDRSGDAAPLVLGELQPGVVGSGVGEGGEGVGDPLPGEDLVYGCVGGWLAWQGPFSGCSLRWVRRRG